MALIGVDWGTSRLRGYLIDNDGTVYARHDSEEGLLRVVDRDFEGALTRLIGAWPDTLPVLMCGMVGSRQGWREAPYVDCPVDPARLVAGIVAVPSRRPGGIRIVPGIATRDEAGLPDVARGEETQVLGALTRRADLTYWILPGTHSKHVQILHGRIVGFSTFMTGEVFALLKAHSILGRTMKAAGFDRVAFAEGFRRAAQSNGLLHHLFGARGRLLFGELAEQGVADYVSGLLIGHELKDARLPAKIGLIGEPEICRRYAHALSLVGREAVEVSPDIVATGLFGLGRDAGLIPPRGGASPARAPG